MRDTFVRTLIALAKEDPNIELMTGDLGFGVLKPFWEQLPDPQLLLAHLKQKAGLPSTTPIEQFTVQRYRVKKWKET